MNRRDSRKIAETITNEQLQDMFDNARIGIKDWTKTSIVNKGMTKGSAWNILAANFKLDSNHHVLGKTNMIREFGEFLPEELKIKKAQKPKGKPPIHQEPKF